MATDRVSRSIRTIVLFLFLSADGMSNTPAVVSMTPMLLFQQYIIMKLRNYDLYCVTCVDFVELQSY